jgi:hypothetical protein
VLAERLTVSALRPALLQEQPLINPNIINPAH